jgi:acyl-CoA thioester hydrolase
VTEFLSSWQERHTTYLANCSLSPALSPGIRVARRLVLPDRTRKNQREFSVFFCLDQELLLAKESEILIVKVYYADTDAGGVVYYANYLRWFEMDRSEFLEERDVSVAEYARQGYLFAVAHLEIDYLVSAVLGDKLEIRTEIERVRHVRFFVRQSVVRCSDGELLASARLSLACLTPEGKITAMPKSLAKTLKSAIPADGQH